MSGRAILHGYYRSSAAFRVRIALNLKGVPYDSVAHHLRKNEQRSPEYLALNPQGVVPTLEIDGQKLFQSLAIIEYLDETTRCVRTVTLVLPRDANITEGRISILTPMGAALYGLLAGSSINWPTLDGEERCLSILSVSPPISAE